MQTVAFGGARNERLEIAVQSYERSATGDYYDDNWLRVVVSVQCGAFSGKYQAAFLAVDFASFHSQLAVLYESLKGEARFETLEDQLSLVLMGDGIGHIRLDGEAVDQTGIGNRLHFSIQIDQSQLAESIRSLAGIVSAFPVRT